MPQSVPSRDAKNRSARPISLGIGFVVLFGSALLWLLSGCEDDNPVGSIEPTIINNSELFSFRADNLESVDTVVQYGWSNAGNSANIDQSSSISSGSATLRITDADRMEVYARSLSENGSFTTPAGASGVWVVRLEFRNTSGAINFKVQRR